jgi:hypothetical protein
MQPFPSAAPFRIDQVTANAGLMAAIFVAQLALALLMQRAANRQAMRLWWGAAAALLTLVALFFTLGSWGTSDVTKLSRYYAEVPSLFEVLAAPGRLLLWGRTLMDEPFWVLVGPIVTLLPYRMAALHGLVVAAYGAVPLLLARHWRIPQWGGWWCLLITCSPMFRGFFQNGHTRQALAFLLLLPVMLWAARLARPPRLWVGAGVLLSALSHATFPVNLATSLAPLLVRVRAAGERPKPVLSRRRRLLTVALAVALAGVLLAVVGSMLPVVLQKLDHYVNATSFFSRYAVRREVIRLQLGMLLGVALTCWRRRLSATDLWRSDSTRVLVLFAGLHLLVQATVAWQWIPQVTFRLADGLAFFQLLAFLAWLRHYQALWFVIPALVITLAEWFFGRILPSGAFRCGLDDQFLCVPDRWPWSIRY